MITKHLFGFLVLVPVLLGVWMDVASAMRSIQLIPQYPIVQGSVTLSITGITGKLQSAIWYKGSNADNNQIILSCFPPFDKDSVSKGARYNPRMTHDPNGSLQISNLNITDEGNYTVKIQTERPENLCVYVKIYEMVGKPTIKTSNPQPKEHDTIHLTCNSTNAESIAWSRVSSGVNLPPGTTLSSDNRTLSFNRINRSDSGEYGCEGINPVSQKKSDPIKISVAYGPEDVKIGTRRSDSDSLVSLKCSADSEPAPTYQWRLNGTLHNVQENPLQVDQKTMEQEGNYTCVANNSVTLLAATASMYVNATIAFEDYDSIFMNGFIYGILLVLLVLAAVLAFLFVRYRRHKKQSKTTKNEGPVYENVNVPQPHTKETILPGIPVQPSQDSHYEQLTHKDRAIYNTLASRAGN